jgi:glycosyltransferase involved in cell wall biosynthesis
LRESVRVLQIITGLGAGGAERLVLDLLPGLASSGIDVRIVSLSADVAALGLYGHQSRQVEVFDLRIGARLKSALALRRYVRDLSPDVIHAHMYHGLLGGLFATWPSNTPVCFTSHCFGEAFTPLRRVVLGITKRLRAADIVFSPDQHRQLNAEHTVVIPNGVPIGASDVERRPWTTERPVRLLAVGRLADQKDPLGLIRHFARVSDRAELNFVGDGPLRRDAEELVRARRLEHKVRFLGVRDDVRELMKASDVLVMHSKYEGMPMAVLEAGAEAMPVIATPVGALVDVLGNENGWLAESAAFRDTLEHVLASPVEAISRGKRLHSHVVNSYSIESAVRAHASLYRRLTEPKRAKVFGL